LLFCTQPARSGAKKIKRRVTILVALSGRS
jgi:hypothetical protein